MSYQIHFRPPPAEVLQGLRRFLARVLQAVAKEMDFQNELAVSHIIEKKLSAPGPETLGVRTGRLRRSIRRTKAIITGSAVESSIGSNVEYAGIHEYGGQTRPHIIRARNGKALAFAVGGKMLFRRSVKHPGSKIKARGYIRKSLEERSAGYGEALGRAVVRAWRERGGR